MAKKQKNIKNKAVTNKSHYFVLVAIIVLVATFISFFIFSNKDRYYECTQFLDGQGIISPTATNNRLKNYEYYRLYLHDDGTFVLKYRLAETNDERKETGTYKFKNNNTKLVLTYNDPKQEMDETCTYTVDGDYLVRDETVEFSIDDTYYYYIVQQKFKYK